MYGIPLNFPKELFVGKIIELISFSANQVILHFNGPLKISVESSFSLNKPAETCMVQSIPLASSDVIRVIGHEVTKVEIEDDNKTLLFYLSEGDELRLYDDSSAYESLKVDVAGKEIII